MSHAIGHRPYAKGRAYQRSTGHAATASVHAHPALRGARGGLDRAAPIGLEAGAVALVEVFDEAADAGRVAPVDPRPAGGAAAAAGVEVHAIGIAATLAGEI